MGARSCLLLFFFFLPPTDCGEGEGPNPWMRFATFEIAKQVRYEMFKKIRHANPGIRVFLEGAAWNCFYLRLYMRIVKSGKLHTPSE